ncbi:hypothetical protein N7456_004010 [Penicillium angulare]|uniref:Zn(2)-C6 fungal-type domain-containing protein n=1 Tax=Penicillium angulare TaxID=116970 RepID=A0A9W9FVP6_9EURO|nr:hypothetical protein N7456_004010 [Penicillium angulare]
MTDPACLTCREKCRRCDRGKPTCGRCATKGLGCMYPNKFRFHSVSAPAKQNNRNHESTHLNHVIQFEPENAKDTHYWEGFDESSWEGFSPHMDEQDSMPRDRGTQNGSSSTNSSPVSGQQNDGLELNELLMLERTQRILTYCMLDVIRSLSDPKRISFSSDLRRTIIALSTPKFEQVNGCPRDLFLMVGDALEYAKLHGMGELDELKYKKLVMDVHLRINAWQLADWNFPDKELRWDAVGESFRNSLLLYTSRILSPEQPAEASFIQKSVASVLDAVSEIPYTLIELVIMPLFIAGTDTLSLHSRHYILLILDNIKSIAGFSNELPKRLLQQVWEARGNQPKRDRRNILWTSFVSLSNSLFEHF